jgi:flagellar basal-body rod protein FlgF
MDDISYIALSRGTGLRKSLNVTANNIANMNTSGFKKDHMVFSEYLEKSFGVPSHNRETSLTQDKATFLDLSQGSLERTGNQFDVAIQGNGWFSYQLQNGEQAFSRDGQLILNGIGNLVNSSGEQILDIGGGPINIPSEVVGNINISNDGSISDQNGNNYGQIGVFDVQDIQNLERLGAGMFKRGEQTPLIPSLEASVAQGFVEGSNVQAVVEMTKMMSIEKSYGHVTKLMQNAHDLEKNTINKLGRAAR